MANSFLIDGQLFLDANLIFEQFINGPGFVLNLNHGPDAFDNPLGIFTITDVNSGLNLPTNGTYVTVPEPPTLALMAVGLLGLMVVFRRRLAVV